MLYSSRRKKTYWRMIMKTILIIAAGVALAPFALGLLSIVGCCVMAFFLSVSEVICFIDKCYKKILRIS